MNFFVARVEGCWLYSPVYYTGRGSRWRISPEQGMFYCHQHSRDISAAFSIRLHFSYVWMAKIPRSQGKEKEKQVSALFSCLILITPGIGQLQINELLLADYSSHHSQYVALLWSVGYRNSKTRNSNSFISFTDFNSLKVAFFFIFTLHIYFERVLLKCIFLADNNLALYHLDIFIIFIILTNFLQSLQHLCPVTLFSSKHISNFVAPCDFLFSVLCQAPAQETCSSWLQCLLLPLVSQMLHFLSQILDVDLDFLFYSPAYFHGWQKKQQPQTLIMKIHRWMTALL